MDETCGTGDPAAGVDEGDTARIVDLDSTVAHNARVWNYWLGGKDNYRVDREAGDRVRQMFPSIVDVARADRAFLGRAVRFMAGDAGIRQFLDVGTGLPTADNTHEVAQRVAPDARIVYADNDPLVLTHARALLTSSPEGATDYIEADAHDPAAIVRAAGATLRLDRPVGVLLLGLLNFIVDIDLARRVVTTLLDAVPSGSFVAITHPTLELGGEQNERAMAFWNEHATPKIVPRTRDEVASFLTGLDVLEPGIVPCSLWRPDSSQVGAAASVPQFGLVARKP